MQLAKNEPQPQRICPKCLKKLQAILTFRSQCTEAENILNELQKTIKIEQPDIEQTNGKRIQPFGIDELLNTPIVEKRKPTTDCNICKADTNTKNGVKKVKTKSAQRVNPRASKTKPLSRIKKSITKKKEKKVSNNLKCIDNKLPKEEIIAASKKCIEKKCKKPAKPDGEIELCELCGLSFANSTDYKKHVRSHEDKGKRQFRFSALFLLLSSNSKHHF